MHFLLNFVRFLSDHLTSLSRSSGWQQDSLVYQQLPSFVWSGNMLRACSALSSSSLMKLLNRTGTSVDACGTPPVIGLQQDSVITTLWALFSVHLSVYSSSPYFNTTMRVKSLTEVEEDNSHFSSHLWKGFQPFYRAPTYSLLLSSQLSQSQLLFYLDHACFISFNSCHMLLCTVTLSRIFLTLMHEKYV